MKTENKIIGLSIILALVVWGMDSFLDYVIFYDGTFRDLLIYDIPAHELYIRSTILIFFLVFGIIISRVLTKKKQSEEKYRSLIENANDAIISSNEEGEIVGFNKKAEEIFGYSCEEILGKSVLILSAPSRREEGRKGLEEIRRKNKKEMLASPLEREGLRKDGQEIPIESSLFAIEVAGKLIITAVIRDISERKKAEKEIKETRDFLANIIKSSRDAIFVTDVKGTILSVNSAGERLYGLRKDAMVGEHISLLTTSDSSTQEQVRERLEELYEQGFIAVETRHITEDGKYIDVEYNLSIIVDSEGNKIGGVAIIRDVTERKKIEKQLLQSEKLKSPGELAGGVAHDFNNVLAAILGRAQLLKMVIEPLEGMEEKRKSVIELKEGLEVIEQASRDGAETVRRIQEFSRIRDDDKHFATVNLNGIIDNAIDFTKTRWKGDAESKGIKITIQKELSILPTTSGSASELCRVSAKIPS